MMAEDLDAIFEIKATALEKSGQQQFGSHKFTLGVLRFVAWASLIIGVLVAIVAFVEFAEGRNRSFNLAVLVGALVQGFFIFAFFNALALIVENLVGIRANLTRTTEKKD